MVFAMICEKAVRAKFLMNAVQAGLVLLNFFFAQFHFNMT